MMTEQLALVCPNHPDVTECPDKLVDRRATGAFVLLVHDGGSSGISIAFCPWCGRDLASTS